MPLKLDKHINFYRNFNTIIYIYITFGLKHEPIKCGTTLNFLGNVSQCLNAKTVKIHLN